MGVIPERMEIAYWMPLQFGPFRAILRGLRQAVDAFPGVHLIYLGELSREQQRQWLERCPGAIVALTSPDLAEHFLQHARKLVNVSSRLAPPPTPAVLADNAAIGRLAAEYLARRRFWQAAAFGWPGYYFSDHRLAAFAEQWRLLTGETPPLFYHDDFAGLMAWAKRHRPAAVYTANDILARFVIEVAAAEGIAVPAQLAVMGSDDDPLESDLSPMPITGIRCLPEVQGKLALATIVALVRGQPVPDVQMVSPVGVVSRRSTDAVAVASRPLARALSYIHGPEIRFEGVDEVVRAAGVPRRSLERLFRDELHTTVLEELTVARLERAHSLLRGTASTVDEIARAVGYEDGHVLSIACKRVLGRTPTQLRRDAQPRPMTELPLAKSRIEGAPDQPPPPNDGGRSGEDDEVA